nr:MAG TPA: hypothetical protein [Caudoviricetes sp.]
MRLYSRCKSFWFASQTSSQLAKKRRSTVAFLFPIARTSSWHMLNKIQQGYF